MLTLTDLVHSAPLPVATAFLGQSDEQLVGLEIARDLGLHLATMVVRGYKSLHFHMVGGKYVAKLQYCIPLVSPSHPT